jgi:hypothetical protein
LRFLRTGGIDMLRMMEAPAGAGHEGHAMGHHDEHAHHHAHHEHHH